MTRMQEEEQKLLDYVPRDATLRPQVPSLLVRWFQIRFSNWLEKQWSDRDEPPHRANG